jgi:hypothetical protein
MPRATRSDQTTPPPTATARGHLALQSRRFFTSRHGNLSQVQSLSRKRVTPIALTFEVGPVPGRASFKALLFHFEFCKFGLQPPDLRIQAVNVRLLAAR